jgi:RNA recognition motif-containing protein
MTIYVGNLSHQATEQEVIDLFSEFGEVSSVKLMKDNFTGRSRGFGFVEMSDPEAGQKAIDTLHNTEFLRRPLIVNEARPKPQGDRPPRQYNDRNSGGYRGGGDRY